jgi:hypothetical protein
MRNKQEILDSIYNLASEAFSLSQTVKNAQQTKGKEKEKEKEIITEDLISKISLFESFGDNDMDKKEIEIIFKRTIEPILFAWVQEHMPRITREVIEEVAKKNKIGQDK